VFVLFCPKWLWVQPKKRGDSTPLYDSMTNSVRRNWRDYINHIDADEDVHKTVLLLFAHAYRGMSVAFVASVALAVLFTFLAGVVAP
jgi:hypothetical protein